MKKLKNINILLFICLGLLLIIIKKKSYAFPGITLEARKSQLEEIKIELESQGIVLLQELRNITNNNTNNNGIENIQDIHMRLNNNQTQLLATIMEINNITEQLKNTQIN
ncbi:hypothetical protein M33023_02490 [Candidatus Phytoplasma asteris]|uniref:Sequence-variable mosaic (SVM) signal sequence domain-containing protein n=1 Tax=Candidatus Phytoplasma asteris TaxID=85620 RepID=A0ABZ2YG02_9MOLU